MDLYSGTPALRLAIDDTATYPSVQDVLAHFDADVQVRNVRHTASLRCLPL